MSWLYRVFKLNPYSTTSRAEGEIQIQKISKISFDSTTTVATVGTLTTLDFPSITALNLDTQTASINFTYPNIAIFASTATPWLTATTKAGTAGPGSLWLCSSGTLFIKTGSGATTGWICALAVAT